MGLASGSALAAATIFALSLIDGIRMTRLMTDLPDVFDISFHLSPNGRAQAYGSAHFTTVHKCYVVSGSNTKRTIYCSYQKNIVKSVGTGVAGARRRVPFGRSLCFVRYR